MKILTIINSIVLILILIKLKIIPIKFQQHTSTNNKIVGYSCLIKNFYFYIPLRNREKINLKENIKYLKTLDYQQKKQHLSAIFSWFKSNEEVDKFEKNYSCVDKEIVTDLVTKFKIKSIRT